MTTAANDNRGRERRGEPRRRVLLSGKLAWPETPYSSDCSIYDLTEAGARIKMSEPLSPNDPVLVVLRSGLAHTARTVWRRGAMAGLQFQDTIDFTQGAPEHLKRVRQLWIDRTRF